MAAMQTTMIRASMTAYSTAVGPSSRFRNSTTKLLNLHMCLLPWGKKSDTGSKNNDSYSQSRRGTDSLADRGERLVGVLTQDLNGGDADDDNQRQHDRVLDGRRAIFTLQELDHEVAQLTHVPSPF